MSNNSKPIIYIIDDDIASIKTLADLLDYYGFKTVMFSSAKEFLAHKRFHAPSCLLLDINLPDMNGIALQDTLTRRKIDIPIVFITGLDDIELSVKTIKAGAVDYLLKPFSQEALIKSIRQALKESIIKNKESIGIQTINKRLKTLSPRELQVFRLVAKGMLSKEVAYKLGIALQTIKTHRARVMKKMQARTLTQLITFAQKVGII